MSTKVMHSIKNDRGMFKNFWDNYSATPDNRTMMLNQNADDFEELDRNEILLSLPDLTGMDIVDVGAGIGRFTTCMSKKARHVLSTDFIESFIIKNRERNEPLGNVSFKIIDAVGLHLENHSVDLVFTNWLMMYLSDSEVITFINHALGWLRPNGYMHLRESCSEPSTISSKKDSMHMSSDPNPTFYRFTSQYINLLRSVRFIDDSDREWRFQILWACSVRAYVERLNWRQVHWLARKVPVDGNDVENGHQNGLQPDQRLLNLFSKDCRAKQLHVDSLEEHRAGSWTDFILIIPDRVSTPDDSFVFAFNARHHSKSIYIDAHRLARSLNCRLWAVEIDPFYFRTSLSKANRMQDRRVQFSWCETLEHALKQWMDPSSEGRFQTFVGCETMTVWIDALPAIRAILEPGGLIITLEPVKSDQDESRLRKILSEFVSKQIQIIDVTGEVEKTVLHYDFSVSHFLSEEHFLAYP